MLLRNRMVWLTLLMVAVPIRAETRTVGFSEADYSSIQEALNASQTGDVILVFPGDYYEDLDFSGKSIELRSSDGAAATRLCGSQVTITISQGESSSTLIQGFTLSGSHDTLRISGASPQVLDSIFLSSSGEHTAVVENGSNALFRNVTFQGNTATSTLLVTGSATRLTLESCVFSNNAAESGGGLEVTSGATVQIQNTAFTDNYATRDGGAVYLATGASAGITGSRFENNTAASSGGAIYLLGANMLVRDSSFAGH